MLKMILVNFVPRRSHYLKEKEDYENDDQLFSAGVVEVVVSLNLIFCCCS